MRLGVVQAPILGLALGTKPKAVPIAPQPPLGIPIQATPGLDRLPLQLVEEHEGVQRVVLHGVTLDVGERRGSIGVGNRRNGCQWLVTCPH